MQSFTTRMSPMVIILTVAIHLFVVVTICSSFRTLDVPEAVLVSALMLALFLPVFLLRPFRYDLEGDELVIRKHLLPRRIPVSAITRAEAITYAELRITIRLWASGGLWGWYGIFLSSKYGRLNMQCTTLKQLVMLTLADGRKIILSPEDQQSLINALVERNAALE